MRVSQARSSLFSVSRNSRSCWRASGATASWMRQPAADNRNTERRLSPWCVRRNTRPFSTSRASARLIATLSIAVSRATARADRPSPS
ncbi:MAG: hypothetical protein OJF61_000249 [Rhodanobacteraceae bacterium]|nr:MAG: hypothetical protein OJF61_000249 [Rhodanobacteraceae bacterium]